MIDVKETPERLVENGKFHLGAFKKPFKIINSLDADPFGLGGLTPRALRKIRLKDWQHFAVIHPDFYFGTIIFDTGVIAKTFFYIYDRRSHKLSEHVKMLPASSVKLAENQYSGNCVARASGYNLEYVNRYSEGYHEITVDIAAARGLPGVKGAFKVLDDSSRIQPLIACLPLNSRGDRAMYTQKVITPAEGELTVGSELVRLERTSTSALVDIHRAFYPSHFYWKWANFAGFDSKNNLIGATFTDNLIENQKDWNENAIWLNGKMSLLGPVRFDFDPAKTSSKPWSIRDLEGRVELSFSPEGEKIEEMNFGIMKVHYRQPFGKFNGRMIDSGGTAIEVKDLFGVTEHMDSKL